MAKLSAFTAPNTIALNGENDMTSFSHHKASYAIMSYNTSSTAHEIWLLDSEFQRIASSSITTQYGHTGNRWAYDGTVTTGSSLFNGVSPSQSNQASNSGVYLGGNYHGEYGCVQLQVSSKGEMSPRSTRWPTTSTTQVGRDFAAWFNSDHQDKTKVLSFYQGVVRVSSLDRPWSAAWGTYNRPGFTSFTPSGFPSGNVLGSMWGSASYNAVRKELVVMAYNSNATGRFDIGIYKNVDLDANGVNVSALSVPTSQFSVTTPSWSTTDNESRYSPKVVLTDNGDIYYSVFFQSSSQRLYRVVRATGDASGTVSLLDTQGTSTSYGRDQGNLYGQKSLQTRNRNMVMLHSPYYYYGCGIVFHVVDKRNNSWMGNQYGDTSFGHQPMKYRDDSFATVYAGNYYADNYTGAYIQYYIGQNPTAGGSPTLSSVNQYFPGAPQPNTTNYIGVTHVWDYDLLTIPPAYSGTRR